MEKRQSLSISANVGLPFLQLARIGRQIEAYFGCPQDIEWCLVDDTLIGDIPPTTETSLSKEVCPLSFFVVQSRPITTLYPIPEANDQENHVYVSVGHQQMMTDPIKPLGMSIFRLTSFGPRFKAGGRLFVDVTPMLASPDSRNTLLNTMGEHDPLIKDALMTIVERGDFIKSLPNDNKEQSPNKSNKGISSSGSQAQIENDPTIVTELIKSSQTSIEELKQTIQTKSGSDLIDFILEDIQILKKILFDPQSFAVFMAAIDASSWINEKMDEWLGEKNVADTLSQSVPNNITSEMGLDLLDVADVIRPYPEVIDYLQHVKDDNFLEKIVKFDGGQVAQDAIYAYLNKYGMRCAEETKRMIDLIRNFIGYREYPKYGMVNRYFVYKQALLKEAEQLVQEDVIHEKEDIYYLTLEDFAKSYAQINWIIRL